MSDQIDDVRSRWVERVLGYVIDDGSPASAARRRWRESFDAYRDAIETVDQRMETLAAACRHMSDPWLIAIANEGLPGVVGDYAEPLMAACVQVDNAAPEKMAAVAGPALSAAGKFIGHLGDPKVAGCDKNPFGIPIGIQTLLGPALASLEAALKLASKETV